MLRATSWVRVTPPPWLKIFPRPRPRSRSPPRPLPRPRGLEVCERAATATIWHPTSIIRTQPAGWKAGWTTHRGDRDSSPSAAPGADNELQHKHHQYQQHVQDSAVQVLFADQEVPARRSMHIRPWTTRAADVSSCSRESSCLPSRSMT